MILSTVTTKAVVSHESPIVNIIQFENNSPSHFISVADNGEMKEWCLDQDGSIIELGTCTLLRPSDEILIKNKHRLMNLTQKNDYVAITFVLQFKNFIALGYEDGLILIYEQEVQKWEKKGPDNEIEAKCYSNYFSLYYILLGHSQKISAMEYIESTNMLVTASHSAIVKIYNMENGHSLYHFNLDCLVNFIIPYKKKNEQYIAFICQEPFELVINISKEPLTFNHYTFKYNNISQVVKVNDGYYLLGQSVIYHFDQKFEYKEDIQGTESVGFQYLLDRGNGYFIWDSEGFVRNSKVKKLVKAQPENDKKAPPKKDPRAPAAPPEPDRYIIDTEYKMKLAEDIMNKCYFFQNKFIIMGCIDGKVYITDMDDVYRGYDMCLMQIEDKLSLEMNQNLEVKKPKKKGKAAGGKEKLPKIKKKK